MALWDVLQLALGVSGSFVVAYLFFKLQETRNERRNNQLLEAIQKAASDTIGPRARPKDSQGRISHVLEEERINGDEDWTESYRGVAFDYAEPRELAARLGKSKWLRRIRATLNTIFVLLVLPWAISFWLTRWNLTDEVIISFDWFEFPPARPLIRALLDFEQWGFWVLLALLLTIIILTWFRSRWRKWSFLHPYEVRFYPDGTTLALSEDVVTPSRALQFLLRNSVSITLVVAAASIGWFLLAPYTQLPPNVIQFETSSVLIYLPTYLAIVMFGWIELLSLGASVLGSQLSSLREHHALMNRLRARFGSPTPKPPADSNSPAGMRAP